MKKIVDERQEAEFYKIEHYGFWVMFIGLLVAITYQVIFVKSGVFMIGGETIVFLVGGGVVLVGCFRKGLWSYISEPTVKNYILYSIVFTILYSGIFAVKRYVNCDYFKEDITELILPVGIFSGFIFVFMFGLLFICGTLVKKRRKKLEDKFEDDDK